MIIAAVHVARHAGATSRRCAAAARCGARVQRAGVDNVVQQCTRYREKAVYSRFIARRRKRHARTRMRPPCRGIRNRQKKALMALMPAAVACFRHEPLMCRYAAMADMLLLHASARCYLLCAMPPLYFICFHALPLCRFAPRLCCARLCYDGSMRAAQRVLQRERTPRGKRCR